MKKPRRPLAERKAEQEPVIESVRPDDFNSRRAKLLASTEERNAAFEASELRKENAKLQKQFEASKERDAVQVRIAVALEKIASKLK